MKKSEDKCPEFLGRNGTGNNSWGTPDWLFAYLNKRFNFSLDPCADRTNYKCKRYYTEADNGLFQDWFNERVYLNPPYGNELCKWVAKSAETQPDVWNNFSRFIPFINIIYVTPSIYGYRTNCRIDIIILNIRITRNSKSPTTRA